jgi:hypothetical protein
MTYTPFTPKGLSVSVCHLLGLSVSVCYLLAEVAIGSGLLVLGPEHVELLYLGLNMSSLREKKQVSLSERPCPFQRRTHFKVCRERGREPSFSIYGRKGDWVCKFTFQ